MSFEDPWFREGKRMSPLDAERRLYEQTKNPTHAWRALEICSELMRGGAYGCDTLPHWLLDYLDTSTEGVRHLFYNAGDLTHAQMVARLADALGFKATRQGVRTRAWCGTANATIQPDRSNPSPSTSKSVSMPPRRCSNRESRTEQFPPQRDRTITKCEPAGT
jgi:hypothetical protein